MPVSSLIAELGGPSAVARALKLASPSTVVKWSARESIPAGYWAALLAYARQQNHSLTADALTAMHASHEAA